MTKYKDERKRLVDEGEKHRETMNSRDREIKDLKIEAVIRTIDEATEVIKSLEEDKSRTANNIQEVRF